MKTVVVNEHSIKRGWYIVDATNVVLGRLASNIAKILIGKDKPLYSPNQDHGDNVIVINADKVRLTGKKADMKEYFRHSKYPGGDKTRPFATQMKLDSTKVIEHAIHGMVSKNPKGRAVMKKLHIYTNEKHPHIAQKPVSLSFDK